MPFADEAEKPASWWDVAAVAPLRTSEGCWPAAWLQQVQQDHNVVPFALVRSFKEAKSRLSEQAYAARFSTCLTSLESWPPVSRRSPPVIRCTPGAQIAGDSIRVTAALARSPLPSSSARLRPTVSSPEIRTEAEQLDWNWPRPARTKACGTRARLPARRGCERVAVRACALYSGLEAHA